MYEIQIFQNKGSITCDFKRLEEFLDAKLAEYKNLVFTEETKKDAKSNVAELRKAQKELLDKVKEAKKEFMKPFDTFNEQATEMARKFDPVIIAITDQIDAFEESRKKEKDEKIKEIFAEFVFEDDILEYLPLSRVYNDKWLNATYTEKQIKDDIMKAKMDVKTGLQTIKSFESDVEAKALEIFKQTLLLTDAIKVMTDYEANKRVFKNKVETEARADAVESFIPVDNGEEVKAHIYTIFLTEDAKKKLEDFMDTVGIDYREE